MARIFGVVDHPREEETVGSVIGIQGWALSDNFTDDLSIEIFVNDEYITKSDRNKIRSDVANAYPHIKNSDKSGFHMEVKLDKFEDGTHVLKVIAKTSTNSEIICERKFSLIKKISAPTTLTQPPLFSGWGMSTYHELPWNDEYDGKIFRKASSDIKKNFSFGKEITEISAESIDTLLWRHWIVSTTVRYAMIFSDTQNFNFVECGVADGWSAFFTLREIAGNPKINGNFSMHL